MPGPGEDFYGTVFIRQFDQGVVETIGGTLTQVTRDEEIADQYVLDLAELAAVAPEEFNNKVPILFWPPEGVYDPYLLPAVHIKPGDPLPSWLRYEYGGTAYRLPAQNATQVTDPISGITGWDQYEERKKSYPFDLTYDIEIRGRKRWHKVCILESILKNLIERTLFLTDTAGNERSYDLAIEGISNLDELVAVADRTLVYVISILVYGEFDLTDPDVYKSVTVGRPEIEFEKLNVIPTMCAGG